MIANFVPPSMFKTVPNLYLAKKPATAGITKSNSTLIITNTMPAIIYIAILNYVNQLLTKKMHDAINYISTKLSINVSITVSILILLKPYSASGINTLLSLFIMTVPPHPMTLLSKSKSLLFFIFFITLLHK